TTKEENWRAKEGEGYYAVSNHGDIIEWCDSYDFFDNEQYEIGNYFRNLPEAKESKSYKDCIRN
ncbi:MAG: hypothetical protein ACRC5T_10635, partial [Cetobacterium sp.]